MDANDILRLAGIQNTFSLNNTQELPNTTNDSIKYILLNAIEKYNDSAHNNNVNNAKQLYADIIKKIDDIIGCVISNNIDNAKQLFDALDSNIKNNILALDTDNKIKDYFKCSEPSNDITFQITKESCEDVESIKVPTEIIKDIKMVIKELDDGNNYEYVSHLSGAKEELEKYGYIKQVLEQLLDYFTKANNLSINHAATYISSLDSDTKIYVPASVWKFLAVNYSKDDSILDRMKKIDTSKVFKLKSDTILEPVKIKKGGK
jgi:hypothetical protein